MTIVGVLDASRVGNNPLLPSFDHQLLVMMTINLLRRRHRRLIYCDDDNKTNDNNDGDAAGGEFDCVDDGFESTVELR
jgi:hypothetical protein